MWLLSVRWAELPAVEDVPAASEQQYAQHLSIDTDSGSELIEQDEASPSVALQPVWWVLHQKNHQAMLEPFVEQCRALDIELKLFDVANTAFDLEDKAQWRATFNTCEPWPTKIIDASFSSVSGGHSEQAGQRLSRILAMLQACEPSLHESVSEYVAPTFEFLTMGAQAFSLEDSLVANPVDAAVWGMIRTVMNERVDLSMRLIDSSMNSNGLKIQIS